MRQFRMPNSRSRGLLLDFIFRAWPGWFVLLGAGVWWSVTGGPQTTGPCIKTTLFEQVWNTVFVLMLASGFYDLWSMKRAEGTPEYQDAGTWHFTLFAWLLSLITVFFCNIPG